VVELLTALLFLGSWLVAGRQSVGLALVYCLFLAGLVAATFIDLEHFIIPDEISLGGIAVGLACSGLVPRLHGQSSAGAGLMASGLGAVVGGAVLYLILRGGKLLFGRHELQLAPGTRIIFTETALVLPDRQIPYEELFYRKSDCITFQARQLELVDRGYPVATVRLRPDELRINNDRFDPEAVPHMEAVVDRITLPREAMGLGDVKLMAAIGAFLGWKATLFTLLLSSMVGATVGLTLIITGRRQWSSRLPYGPYLALGAVAWVFGGGGLLTQWLQQPLWPGLFR
jgi:leader peptidase (prepilin peptidase)/N-methyltransferase